MKRLILFVVFAAITLSFNCSSFHRSQKPTTYECERAKRVCREANRFSKANKEWGVFNTSIEERQKMANWECEEAKINCEKSLQEQLNPSHEK